MNPKRQVDRDKPRAATVSECRWCQWERKRTKKQWVERRNPKCTKGAAWQCGRPLKGRSWHCPNNWEIQGLHGPRPSATYSQNWCQSSLSRWSPTVRRNFWKQNQNLIKKGKRASVKCRDGKQSKGVSEGKSLYLFLLRYNWHTINSTYFKCAVWQVLTCESITTLEIVNISITPKVSYAPLWSIPPAKLCSLLGNPDLLFVTIDLFAFSWSFM